MLQLEIALVFSPKLPSPDIWPYTSTYSVIHIYFHSISFLYCTVISSHYSKRTMSTLSLQDESLHSNHIITVGFFNLHKGASFPEQGDNSSSQDPKNGAHPPIISITDVSGACMGKNFINSQGKSKLGTFIVADKHANHCTTLQGFNNNENRNNMYIVALVCYCNLELLHGYGKESGL